MKILTTFALLCADPRSWKVGEVQDWVESTGFYEYRQVFLEGNINGKKLLDMDAASLHKDLLMPQQHCALFAMELGELRARRGLFRSRKERDAHFAAHPPAESWDVNGVLAFLHDAGFARYVSSFAAAAIDGKALLRLRDAEIQALVSQSGQDDPYEENGAKAEQLVAVVAHLRWRSAGVGKDEL